MTISIGLGILLGSIVAQGVFAAAPAASQRWDFEDVTIGKLPDGWKVEGTNQDGPVATWEVVEDKSAPAGTKVLSLTRSNHTSEGTFNLCWSDKSSFKNGELSVRLKANSGKEDQGGGLIWRALDKDNSYICRANPLENNIRVYYVKGSKRSMLKSAPVEMASGQWHTLRIVHEDTHIHCFFNGKLLLEVDDSTFANAGGIGLWTKADAATSFDGLEVHTDASQSVDAPAAPVK
ncbi:MAG: DUF1080 domain-containing protein [Candidatus Hydrogenedentes bacterium]|nr:DUF1080 domain-containing protein [Candidatus Hydrogenedentota bacterium]